VVFMQECQQPISSSPNTMVIYAEFLIPIQ
jgi:hypothetical protein